MRLLVTSCLIRIVYHSVSDFRLKPLFTSVDKSKFKNGRVHLRNSGMAGLNHFEYDTGSSVDIGTEVSAPALPVLSYRQTKNQF